ncbi:MAG: hypothetical protein AAF623_15985 [Planctomycetota bacterium]
MSESAAPLVMRTVDFNGDGSDDGVFAGNVANQQTGSIVKGVGDFNNDGLEIEIPTWTVPQGTTVCSHGCQSVDKNK